MAQKLKVAALSEIGNVRSNNEDNLYCNGVYRTDMSEEDFKYFNGQELQGEMCFAIFDGMGGTAYGEEASLTAAQVLKDYQENLGESEFDFLDVISRMNNEVCLKISEAKKDMGSTAVLLLIYHDGIRAANVGDSRAYVYHDRELKQLSKDHTKANSILEFQEKFGIEADIDVSGMHNILSQHLGISEDEFILEPEISESIAGKAGDIYMLCSDGLTGFVSDEKIAEILSSDLDLNNKLFCLRDEALSMGGKDNVSIILVERIAE